MSVFDCLDQSRLPAQPDQTIIDLGRKIDRILEEIKLFSQEAMTNFIATVEKSIAYQEAILNNSLAYIRNIIDIRTNSISNVLTVNRESISNLVSQILTELIVRLNVNGLPVGTELELSKPVAIENYYGGNVTNVDTQNVYGGTAPQVQPSIPAQFGGNFTNGSPNEITGRIAGQIETRGLPEIDKGSSGDLAKISGADNQCKPGSILNLVYPDNRQFYGIVSGSISANNQIPITVLGQVGTVQGENNLTLVNTLLGQSANLPQVSLPEYIATQILPNLAPVVPPLVQSPTGSLLPVGVSNPVDIKQPEAFRFQQRNQPWFRDSVAWAGKPALDFYNSPTAHDYIQGWIDSLGNLSGKDEG